MAPSERYHQTRNHRHKTLLDWARQMLTQVRRWVPHRAIVLVADSSFAALEWLEALRQLPLLSACGDAITLGCCTLRRVRLRVNPNKWVVPARSALRLPTLKSLLDASQMAWQTLTIDGWYGGRTCQLQVTSKTAVWDHTGWPAVPIRARARQRPQRQV